MISSEERDEVESAQKDKTCLTKTLTLPLACMASRERGQTGGGPDQNAEHRIQGSGKRRRHKVCPRGITALKARVGGSAAEGDILNSRDIQAGEV